MPKKTQNPHSTPTGPADGTTSPSEIDAKFIDDRILEEISKDLGLNGPEDGIPAEDVILMSIQDVREGAGSVLTAPPWPRTIKVTEHQAGALERILERDRTAWETHGGLKGLLSLTQTDVDALQALVEALKR